MACSVCVVLFLDSRVGNVCRVAVAYSRDCVLLRGDNEAAVQWVRRCRGGLEPRSVALMRLLGVLDVSSGGHFDALHVRGIHNVVADGISSWDRDSVLVNLRAIRPDVPWQMRDLGDAGKVLCTSVLASNSCGSPLRPRLNALCLLYTSPSPRDLSTSRMPSSA